MLTQSTMRPGQKGTKGLCRKYGDRLVCVRYKYDQETGRRYTTVELIEEEIDPQSDSRAEKAHAPLPGTQRLGIRVEYWETDLRDKVKAAGAIWRPRHRLWEMQYEDIVALGLESRVVGNDPTGQ